MQQDTSKPTEQEIVNQSWTRWLKKIVPLVLALALITSLLPLGSSLTVVIVALIPSIYGVVKVSIQDLKAFNAEYRELINLSKSSSKEDFKERLYNRPVTPLKRSGYRFKGVLALAMLIVISLLLSGVAVGVQDAIYRS